VNKVTNAEKEKNRGKQRTHQSSSGGDGTTASSQKKIQPPLVQYRREAAVAASSVKVSDVIERRRRRAGGRRQRSFFSVPRSGSEAQGTRERRKKKALWGKKSKFTPIPIYISQERVVGIVVSVPLPRPFLREVATWRHGVGRRFL
jgi:hypothetical protein